MKEIGNLLINAGTILLLPLLWVQFWNVVAMLRDESRRLQGIFYFLLALAIVFMGVVAEQLAT